MSSCHFFIPLSEEGREGSQQRSFEGKSSAPSAALRRDLPSLVSYVVRYIQQKRQRMYPEETRASTKTVYIKPARPQ